MPSGGGFEIDDDLRRGERHALPGADVERDTGPAPGVDLQAQRREGLDPGIAGHARLVAVPAELAAHHVSGIERPHRAQQPQLLGAHGLLAASDRRLHRQQHHHLKEVVLHHVADRADLLVEGAAALHAEALGHGDLHAVDVVAVPDRLEEGVGEAEVDEVLHRLLAEEVVDAEHRGLRERRVQRAVELDRAEARSRPNGFSTITRASCAQPTAARPCTTVANMLGGMAR